MNGQNGGWPVPKPVISKTSPTVSKRAQGKDAKNREKDYTLTIKESPERKSSTGHPPNTAVPSQEVEMTSFPVSLPRDDRKKSGARISVNGKPPLGTAVSVDSAIPKRASFINLAQDLSSTWHAETLCKEVQRPKRLIWQSAVKKLTFLQQQHKRFDERIHLSSNSKRLVVKTETIEEINKDISKNQSSCHNVREVSASHAKISPQISESESPRGVVFHTGPVWRGFIIPSVRNWFTSKVLEKLYRRYFLRQRQHSLLAVNIIDILNKLCMVIPAAVFASFNSDWLALKLSVEMILVVLNCGLCLLSKWHKFAKNKLIYVGLLTWMVLTLESLSELVMNYMWGRRLMVSDGAWQAMFTIFVTFTMLSFSQRWAMPCATLTTVLHLIVTGSVIGGFDGLSSTLLRQVS